MYSNSSVETTLQNIASALKQAFSNISSITPLDFNSKISEIPSNINYWNNDPTHLIEGNIKKIKNNASQIGIYAFAECSQLQSADFPNCTLVDSFAFIRCYNLKEINLPNCTSIKEYAFQSCYSLTSINVSNLTSIGYYAFLDCWNLIGNINLDHLKSIELGAFAHCSKISGISLPLCSRIDIQAFYSCKNLTTVYAPNCFEIESGAFSDCSSLETLTLDFSKILYISSHAFQQTKLSSLSLPAVGHIGSYGFSDCELKDIYMPNCTWIAEGAFNGCSSLSRAIFNKPASIYPGAFAGCYDLKVIGNEFNEINLTYVPENGLVQGQLFINDRALPSITFLLNPAVQTNKNFTWFGGCTKLSQMTFLTGSGILNLKAQQSFFSSTPFLNSNYLGYYGSIYVPEIYLSDYKSKWSFMADRIAPLSASPAYSTNSYSTRFIFPYEFDGSDMISLPETKSSVTHVYEYGLNNCSLLSTLNLPECIYLDSTALLGCNNLTEVRLANCGSIPYSKTFYSFNNLKILELPKLTDVSDKCFPSSLEYLNLAWGQSITSTTLFCLSNLKSIVLQRCTYIGASAFRSCYSLSNVELPSTIQSIGTVPFEYCSALTHLTVRTASEPNSIYNSIDLHGMCGNCPSLEQVNLQDTWFDSYNGTAFWNCPQLSEIILTDHFKETLAASNTTPFVDAATCSNLIGNVSSGIAYLGNSTNPYLYLLKIANSNLEQYSINNSCYWLADRVFGNSYCQNVKRIIFPNSVYFKSIFLTGLSALSALYFLGNNIQFQSSSAFYWCDNLKSIYLLSPEYSSVAFTGGVFNSGTTIYTRESNYSYILSYINRYNSSRCSVVGLTDSEVNDILDELDSYDYNPE